jgi:hypothetical protein
MKRRRWCVGLRRRGGFEDVSIEVAFCCDLLRLRYPPFTADDLFLYFFLLEPQRNSPEVDFFYISFVFYVTLGFGM